MREIAVGAIALLIGLVIGGVGPRAELNRMMQTVQSVDAERCKNTFGEDLATFFGGAQAGGLPLVAPAPRSAPPETRAAIESGPDPRDAEVEAALAQIEADEAAATQEVADGMRAALENGEELEIARSALELRRAQSRQALIEAADPDDQQLSTIDNAYDAMNETLEGLAGGLAELVLSGGEPDRRQAMVFAADALDAMLVAEDQVLGALDEGQRADLDADVANPFNHVAPALIDALMDLDADQ